MMTMFVLLLATLVLLCTAQTTTSTSSTVAPVTTTETSTASPSTSTSTIAATTTATTTTTVAPTTTSSSAATTTTTTTTTAPTTSLLSTTVPLTTTQETSTTTEFQIDTTLESTTTLLVAATPESTISTLPANVNASQATPATQAAYPNIDQNNDSGLAASIWLIIVCVAMSILFAAACVYLLVYFQHEEDKRTAWVPKVILLVGMWLSMVNILMLPLDISNAAVNGIIPMNILWQIVLITSVVWACLVIPFAQLYYESEDPLNPGASQVASALKVMILGFVVFAVMFLIGYLFLSVATVPTLTLKGGLIDPDVVGIPAGVTSSSEESVLSFRVSIPLFLISMFTLFGTFFLACFGGIGMAALPTDLINEFRFRPTRITTEEYFRQKLALGNRSTALISIGQQIQEEQRTRKKTGRKARAQFNRFKQNVYLLEEDWNKLHSAHKNRGARVLFSYGQLVLGVFCALLSILWMIHIILFMLPQTPGALIDEPIADVLGAFFRWFDKATDLPLAVVFYAMFAFYLLACIMKGNIKFGLRVFIIFAIHPMRIGGTMLNSFLFNVGLILVTSVAVVQFCTHAFQAYTISSAAASLFGLSIQRLRYIEYFWYFYVVGLFGFALLAFFYLLICPSDRRVVDKD